MEKLSADILFDILSKQPVRSVGQYKCVNKRWLSVISNPQFAKAHLERSGYHPRLLLNTNPIQSVNYELIANSSDQKQQEAAAAPHLVKIDHPVKPPGEWSGVFVGSCDGLVCLLLEDNIDGDDDDDYYYDYDFNSDDDGNVIPDYNDDDDYDDDNFDDDDDDDDDDDGNGNPDSDDDDDDDDDDGNGNSDSDDDDDDDDSDDDDYDYTDEDVDLRLIIWNPTTREHRVLPRPGIHPSRGNFFCGLGYDCVADDYKMLVGHYGSPAVVIVEIFALKTNYWRRLNMELEDGATKISWEASYCNGCLHWLSTTTNQIIIFDMSEERFRTYNAPPVPSPELQGLGIITGDEGYQLFLHSREWNIFGYRECEVWVNNTSSSSSSWTKVHSFPMGWFVVNKRKRIPITLTRDGKKIVCKSSKGEELHLYDPLTSIYKRVKLGIHYWDTAHSNYATYVESLVSPHSGRRHRRIIPKPPPPQQPTAAASRLSSLLIYPRITLWPIFRLHDIVSHLTGLHDILKNNVED